MDIFITGLGTVSPQPTFAQDSFLEEVVEYPGNYLTCIEPHYKDYIDANSARRMGRIIKMGVAAALTCLKEAGVQQPDAIITGTGLGCIQDTEKFLSAIIEHQEQMLTPTSFIQSTHNTISAQIALMLKCLNYNFTYVHRGFSFESSLLDSLMLLREGTAQNVLLGGADETTPHTFTILQRLGHWKRQPVSNLRLLDTPSKGTISGEGASFFLLTNETAQEKYAKVVSVAMVYKPAHYGEVESALTRFLHAASLEREDVDLVVLGVNGDAEGDGIYYHLQQQYFAQQPAAYFKHLCGEYHTASSFGMWLAAKIIRNQHIPDVVKLGGFSPRPIRNVLIYNHYRHINHSFFLLQSC